ncbi:hypothetical protein B9G54_06875 [Alloscardovia macacae]|uniref:Uncharacterized protein n=1 Tax=Alloscardovia macacae TaxID=1160091 RepID=A0A1Y2SV65_9BIFI|nr:hypothetical protein [Alloscardovia macacae]OTA25774.1 hypothetical protein B9G54_06875 [Alloscardovia macacae]OTA28523.1 hypothetical protein B9T39_06495 [Alloscardovia macacae]
MSKEADERILALVQPEYMKKIPAFIRGHATGNSCRLIEKEYPDLYAAFEADGSASGVEAELPSDVVEQMRALINGIFEQRMRKHHML